jgi:hypothetical protein
LWGRHTLAGVLAGAEEHCKNNTTPSARETSMRQVGSRGTKVVVEVGAKHEKLTVIAHVIHTTAKGNQKRALQCQCECGNTTIVGLYEWGNRRVGCGKCDGGKGGKRHKGRKATGFNANHYLGLTLKNAKDRKLEFEIGENEFAYLTGNPCHYCGASSTGLDRIDSDLGYVSNNVVPSCYDCNKAKSKMTKEQFQSWLHRIYAHYLQTSWSTAYVVPQTPLFGTD